MISGQDGFELLAAGVMAGGGIAWWRCMVYARKLRHFGIDLDAWSHYNEREAQAKK